MQYFRICRIFYFVREKGIENVISRVMTDNKIALSGRSESRVTHKVWQRFQIINAADKVEPVSKNYIIFFSVRVIEMWKSLGLDASKWETSQGLPTVYFVLSGLLVKANTL